MTAMDIFNKNHHDIETYELATDRETYLIWVAKWKAAYKELSTDIRKLKAMRKSESDCYDSDATWVKDCLRDRATAMITMRHEAKEWSREQRDANSKQEAA